MTGQPTAGWASLVASSTSLVKAGPPPAFVLARVFAADGAGVAAYVPRAVILARCYRVDRLAASSSMGPVRRCAKRAALPPHRCKRGRPLAYRRPLGAACMPGLRPAVPVSGAWVKQGALRVLAVVMSAPSGGSL